MNFFGPSLGGGAIAPPRPVDPPLGDIVEEQLLDVCLF